ncbi:TetR/AcrR family transcriptional regulator [Nocardia miyunensis]|uniref:TetR/AcrR family transcriptional regulator n=1 Tax=Nocardia miyunensis TaxID=282684 RepID=UPI000A05AC0B|nr:TetR/AcrR family transcriptional regulator [Nocardia miyunensis]
MELTPILAGAVQSFHESGYHGASVREIAVRVGVTVPTLYYHYGSKQGLLIALLESSMQELLDHAEQAVADSDGSPRQRFTNLVEATVLYVTRRVSIAALDSELRYLEPGNRERYARSRKRLEELFREIIQDGVEQGVFEVNYPEDTVRALAGMFQSVVRWYRPDGPAAAEVVAERYCDIALRTVVAARSMAAPS